jgi:hypothetical protein
MKKQLLIVCSLLITSVGAIKAQLSGAYSVPGTYTSVAAIINDLNAQGISGPVTINISAGYTEITPAGGFTLTATGTLANPIIFQKSGVGANPLITAFTGGVGLPNTASQDGIWRFIGCDYITIDGIDLLDPNTTSPDYMEFGYGFFKASATNGCQNNTIKNCVISLNRDNYGIGSGAAVDGCRGIEFVNALTNAHTTALTVTSAGGANSFNKIYSNTIQNVNIGIAMIGFASTSPFTNADQSNDVGGASSATGNMIINFGGATSATTAAAGVRTLAQYNFNVSYNVVNNNNGSGFDHQNVIRGIYLNTATSANATINSNTLTIKSGTTTSQVSVIENVSGATAANNAISINNNLITGCTSNSATTQTWYGIWNNAASCASLSISGNTFSNNTTNATTGLTYLIDNSGAVASLNNITNNNLSFNHVGATAYSGTHYNIYNSASSVNTILNITGNTFSNYNHNVTGTGTMYFIYNGGSSLIYNLNNNLINGLTLNHSGTEYMMYNGSSTQSVLSVANNSITNITRNAGGSMYCYYAIGSSLGTSSHTITNNLFSDITSTVTVGSSFYGFYNSDGSASPYPKKTISGNTVSNINFNGTGTFYGMYQNYLGDGSTTSGSSIYNNTFDNITFGGFMYVMYVSSTGSPNYPVSVYTNTLSNLTSNGASSTIYTNYLFGPAGGLSYFKNKTYNITENGTTGVVYGMYLSATTATVFNNLIGGIFTPNSTGANRANGIYVGGGTTANIFYNSVYLSGTSTGANFGSNAIYASTSPSVNLRNNVFVNNCTPTGTEFAVAYRRSSATLTTYSSTSNNNLFYAGIPSAQNLIYYDGITPQQTLGGFQSVVAPRDAQSVTENPPFITTVGSSPNFLNINTTTPTQIEQGALPIAGITTDYIGTTRNATTPDIGAWEGNFTYAGDIVAPSFLANGFTSPACNTTSRNYTVNLTDVSGVASGSLSPRSYFKVNNGPYTSTQGTLTAGNALNGVWTFSMNYTTVIGDIISYYTVAQDIAATPNLGASPGAGFSGVDVNNITTPPTTPNTFAIVGTLAGTYSVGATGNFTTLTQAANAYNNSCLAGPVTFVLIDPTYSTNESFPIVFNNNPYANSTNSLLVVPNTGLGVTINGSPSANTTIKFLNSQYITFDGLNSGGSSLSVFNPNTGTSAVFWLASTSAIGPGNNSTGLKNMYIQAGGNTSTKYCILAGVDAASPSAAGGLDNDNITVSGNTLTASYYGLYAVSTTTAAGGNNNWNITNNLIGSVVSSTANIWSKGMYISYTDGLAITNNTVTNVAGTTAYVWGIELNNGVRNATVNLNTITGIHYTGTSGYAGLGIDVNPNNAAANITIQNNMISDCTGDGWSSFTAGGIAGIRVAPSGTCVGVKIQNNSVALNQGTTTSAATANEISAAVYFGPGSNNIDLRDNILYSDVEYLNQTGSKTYAIYSAAPSSVFTTINYNDYFTSGSQANLAFIAATSQTNMAMLVASFGQNANSMNVMPNFVGINDMHLVPATNALIDNVGTPIAGITIDIDNQTRSLTTPDVGADEFTAPTCTTANSGTIVTTSYSICNNANITLVANNVSTGAGTSYQWMVSTNPSGPFSNAVGGSGVNTPTYVTAALPTNTLYYVLQTVCSAISMTATSAPSATVLISPIPTASIAASPTFICSGNTLSLTVGTDIGTNFNWIGPANFNSNMQNPLYTVPANGSGNYSVVVSTSNCTAAVQSISVSVNSTSLAISGTGSYFCTSGNVTLTAIGNATTLTWFNSATTQTVSDSPMATTVYSVVGTGTSNCPATAYYTVTVINPTISATGTAVCSSTAVATLSATSFGPIDWYSSPSSTVSLFTGNTYTTTAATTTTYYVQANSTSSGSLFTTLVGGNGFAGNMFDIVANNPITINSVGMHFATANITTTVEVWYKVGTFVGNESSNANWTLAYTTTVLTNGANVLTPIPGTFAINVPASTTYGIYVTTTNGSPTTNYTNGTLLGNLYASNSDLNLYEGKGGGYFSVLNSPRVFNGVLNYTKVGCTSPMIPVTLTVNPQPTVSINALPSSVICAGKTATLTASGADTYTWNTSSTSSAIAVAPTTSTTYTLNANSNTCPGSYTASMMVTVNPNPTLNISASSMSICSGNSVTLNATGSILYNWSTSATTQSISATPSVNTTYSVVGTAANSCTSSAMVTITVNAKPSVSLTAASNTACLMGGPVILTGSPAGGIYSGPNVTGNSLNPTATGTFTPVYSYTNAAGCSNTASTSVVVKVCTEIVSQTAKSTALKVYPNPNLGVFTIETGNALTKTIEMTDLTGKIVHTQTTDAETIQMNIVDLANGVYHVRIHSENGIDVIKVVKQ